MQHCMYCKNSFIYSIVGYISLYYLNILDTVTFTSAVINWATARFIPGFTC